MIDRRRLLSSAFAAPLVLRGSSSAQELLRVLGWAGYADQGVIDRFKAEFGADLVVDNIGAYDEIFLRLRAGGLGEYSVVAPHHGLVAALHAEGLLQPLDETRIPRLSELDDRFLLPEHTVPGRRRLAAPLIWGTCPCIYNADLLPVPPAAWTDLEAEEFTGRVGMQDDSLSHFLLWGRAAGVEFPPNLTHDELDETVLLLTRIKRERVSHFTPYPADLTAQLTSGKIAITTTGWEGMILLPEAAGANLRIARLAPGDFSWLQTLAIAANAPMVDAAHQFIDFMLRPEEQAALAMRTLRGVVHPGAPGLIDEPVRALVDYSDLDAVFATSPMLAFPPITETVDGAATYLDWVTSWERIRLVKSEAAP